MENVTLKRCPDCDELKKDADYIKVHGRCFNCDARKRILSTKGKPYIKFKDLSEQEKEKIIKSRKYQQKNTPKKSIKKENKNNTLIKRAGRTTYSKEFLNFISNKPNLTRREIYNLVIKEFPEYSNLAYKNFENVMGRHNFPFLDGRKERKYIFTSEVQDFINALATEEMEFKDIYFVVKNRFEDKRLNDSNLRSYLLEHNIPYLKTKSLEPNINSFIVEEEDVLQPPFIPIPNEREFMSSPVPVVDLKEPTSDTVEDNIPSRMQLAEEEVNKVLTKKYEEYQCNFDNPYTLDDIIKALEVLSFLKEHKYTIFYTGKLKHKITDAYEKDLCHVMENNIMSKGDMSIIDRLHILRNKRRNLEYQGKDLNIVQSFLKELNLDTLKDLLKTLYQEKQSRMNEKYVPYVDAEMSLKYDWCLAGKRQIPDFSTTHFDELEKTYDEINESKIAEQSRSELSLAKNKKMQSSQRKFIYRVACEVSGGGLGAYRNWWKDITASNEEEALALGNHYIEIFCTGYRGSIHTKLRVTKLNT